MYFDNATTGETAIVKAKLYKNQKVMEWQVTLGSVPVSSQG